MINCDDQSLTNQWKVCESAVVWSMKWILTYINRMTWQSGDSLEAVSSVQLVISIILWPIAQLTAIYFLTHAQSQFIWCLHREWRRHERQGNAGTISCWWYQDSCYFTCICHTLMWCKLWNHYVSELNRQSKCDGQEATDRTHDVEWLVQSESKRILPYSWQEMLSTNCAQFHSKYSVN